MSRKQSLNRRRVIQGLGTLGVLSSFSTSVVSAGSKASEAPAIEWQKTYGGADSEYFYSVSQTDDGGYALIGFTQSYSPFSRSGWLVKTDAQGNEEWKQTYGSGRYNFLKSGMQTSDGGFLLVGYRYLSNYDGWIVKTDAKGNQEWSTTLDIGRSSFIEEITQLSDGSYAFVGSVRMESTPRDVLLGKLTSEGEIQWTQTHGGEDDDFGWYVTSDSNGGFVATGGTHIGRSHGWSGFALRFNNQGELQWKKIYGSSDMDLTYVVIETADDGYALAGRTKSTAKASQATWLLKTNSQGDVEWETTLEDADYSLATSLIQTEDNGFVVAGHSFSPSRDGYLWKTNAEGEKEWSNAIGGSGSENIPKAIRTRDGGIALSGLTSSYGAGRYDGWLVKIKSVNESPVAAFEYSPTPPVAEKPILFDASVSSDPDGSIRSYGWDFDNDGSFEKSGKQIEFMYPRGGEKTVTLRVTDNYGASDTATKTFTVYREVDLDIKPGPKVNRINPSSKGKVSVGVHQSPHFDPDSRLDLSTVRFGAPDALSNGSGATPVRSRTRDLNKDGLDDLILDFRIPETGFEGDEERGKIIGETTDGVPVFGFDSVAFTGKKKSTR